MIFSSWLIPVAHAADIVAIPATGRPADVPDLFNKLLDILVRLAYPLAFIALLYTAYILITSAGKPEAYVTAKKNITYLVIGIFLILFAVIFVRFVTRLFLNV